MHLLCLPSQIPPEWCQVSGFRGPKGHHPEVDYTATCGYTARCCILCNCYVIVNETSKFVLERFHVWSIAQFRSVTTNK